MEGVQKFGRRAVGGQKFCHVCSEKADGSNYGGICCRCCKVFFSHTVRSKLMSKFRCNCDPSLSCFVAGDEQINCVINKDTRRKCKKCRFQKCREIGMQPEFVFRNCAEYNEARSRIPKSMKNPGTQQNDDKDGCSSGGVVAHYPLSLTIEEITKMQNICEYYKVACEQIPYNYPSRTECETLSKTKASILGICGMSTSIRRFVYFVKLLPEFSILSGQDQTILLKQCIIQISLLKLTLSYDATTGTFFTTESNQVEKYPPVQTSEIKQSWPTNLFEMTTKLFKNLLELQVDENAVMLLILITVFSDMPDLLESDVVNAVQESYTALLRKYYVVKFGEERGAKLFSRLLAQLVELRQLSDLHEGFPLHLSDTQVNRIHTVLFNLQTPINNSIQQVVASGNYSHTRSDMLDTNSKVSQCAPQEADDTSYPTEEGNTSLIPFLTVDHPTFPVQKAFMQRIPHLLKNPLDPLTQEK